ncbi:MAG: alpha/beta fold hydrolase [Leptolyngbyaceae cyanobacterium]
MQVLWCLHGNLQQPTAWHDLVQSLKPAHPKLQIQLVDLWETLHPSSRQYARRFCSSVQRSSAANQDRRHYLLGYSLGGRLAWRTLIADPSMWAGAVIVSAGIGLNNELQKERCLQRDRIWANRFLTEPWDALLAEWDALPVFCGYPCTIPRPESDFDRQKIATAFEVYSKGHMDDLMPHLQTLSVPITYVTGSDDRRYCQLGRTLAQQCPTLTHVQIDNAGHRVPWEQPQAFTDVLLEMLLS